MAFLPARIPRRGFMPMRVLVVIANNAVARTVLAGWAVVMLAGCDGGAKKSEVSGTVKFNDTLIGSGSISFIPVDGKSPTAASIIKDGKYSVVVPVGATKVVINGAKVTGEKATYKASDSPKRTITEELLPKKYSDREKSELRYDVTPGDNQKDFDLTSK